VQFALFFSSVCAVLVCGTQSTATDFCATVKNTVDDLNPLNIRRYRAIHWVQRGNVHSCTSHVNFTLQRYVNLISKPNGSHRFNTVRNDTFQQRSRFNPRGIAKGWLAADWPIRDASIFSTSYILATLRPDR
jgi:hypothetical protein